ncbi:hypothetical protein PCANC_16173 [Puccinia coronata f. sp. avenae]|uniref:Uncharacterized protein n=1 Tax=Puccinia coronata f. sp. avenae TaxID=200324 RepID=A0A2N5SZ72_9BASI|nr:hypothetical protein PCANC_16173 [Puccinia coronata f. sp. avenae]
MLLEHLQGLAMDRGPQYCLRSILVSWGVQPLQGSQSIGTQDVNGPGPGQKTVPKPDLAPMPGQAGSASSSSKTSSSSSPSSKPSSPSSEPSSSSSKPSSPSSKPSSPSSQYQKLAARGVMLETPP